MRTNLKTAVFFCLIFSCLSAQTDAYKFSRKLETPSGTWHTIDLPDDGLQHFNTHFSDIRIIGKTENGTQVEVPYLLQKPENKMTKVEIPFQTINNAKSAAAYFYTFELAEQQKINQIQLDFEQRNFDWNIDLEGSQNGSDWFTILENYRILSIKNRQTDYQFTQLDFPDSRYKWYRLKVDAAEQPKLRKASVFNQQKEADRVKISKIRNIQKSVNTKEKTSLITVTLENAVPIAGLTINVRNTFDYYRPITIEALQDSVLTDKGWRLNYKEIYNGTLSSLAQTAFQLDYSLTQKLRITVQNHDNQPLEFQEIQVKHALYSLLARFNEKATYYLYYGNEKATNPSYDIANLVQIIPENPPLLSLSPETINADFKSDTQTPLFENKLWLWILMGIVIVVLGYFSLKMLKE